MTSMSAGDRWVWIRGYNTGGRHGPDRRGRATEINAAKRVYSREHGVRLRLESMTYDEAHGFAHRSEACYSVTDRAGHALRWSVDCASPRWVHVSAADLTTCAPQA